MNASKIAARFEALPYSRLAMAEAAFEAKRGLPGQAYDACERRPGEEDASFEQRRPRCWASKRYEARVRARFERETRKLRRYAMGHHALLSTPAADVDGREVG